MFLRNSLRLSSRNSGLAAMSAFDNEPLAEGVEEGRSRRATGTTARDMGRLPNAASILSRSGRVGEICTRVVSGIRRKASTERISRDARHGAKPTRSWARRNASKSAKVIRGCRSLLEPVSTEFWEKSRRPYGSELFQSGGNRLSLPRVPRCQAGSELEGLAAFTTRSGKIVLAKSPTSSRSCRRARGTPSRGSS